MGLSARLSAKVAAMRTRYKRTKRHKIGPWPDSEPTPDVVAEMASYVGSAEHKDHPSSVSAQGNLRSDATPCEPEMTRDVDRNTEALREGIRRRCVSAVFEEGFPRYVWTWINHALYEARHIRGPQGTYKGYRLEPVEYPKDDAQRLADWS